MDRALDLIKTGATEELKRKIKELDKKNSKFRNPIPRQPISRQQIIPPQITNPRQQIIPEQITNPPQPIPRPQIPRQQIIPPQITNSRQQIPRQQIIPPRRLLEPITQMYSSVAQNISENIENIGHLRPLPGVRFRPLVFYDQVEPVLKASKIPVWRQDVLNLSGTFYIRIQKADMEKFISSQVSHI